MDKASIEEGDSGSHEQDEGGADQHPANIGRFKAGRMLPLLQRQAVDFLHPLTLPVLCGDSSLSDRFVRKRHEWAGPSSDGGRLNR